ncbi:hypothetical protein Tco_0580171 [Tanacetum coccineum]
MEVGSIRRIQGIGYDVLGVSWSNIINYEDLKAKFRSHFIQQKKFTKTHLAVNNIKQREGESTRAFVTRYTDDTLQILGLHEEQRISGFVHRLKTRSLVESLSTDLPITYKGLIEKTYTWIETKEVATNGAPNDHRESFDRFKKGTSWGNNKGNKNRDRSLKVDFKVPLVGFSREKSWPLGEVPLEITIGDSLLIRTKTLNFLIVRSNYPHNLLLRRIAMQKIGIMVSTIHKAIKFNTPSGIGIVFSTYEPNKVEERQNKLKETLLETAKGVLSCMDAEERIVVNNKYPEQTIFMGKQLPTNVKRKLQDLLRSNTDVFAWTYADMTRILRTIMVKWKPFKTDHKLNEHTHIEPVKQKKRGLAPDQNEAICKEVEELTKTNILREVKYQTWVSNPVMVHVDDMVIKSDSEEDMLIDIQETFDRLREINMKLNPRKCSFGIEEGPFLGHLITKQEVKAMPSKVKAISDLKPQKTVNEI